MSCGALHGLNALFFFLPSFQAIEEPDEEAMQLTLRTVSDLAAALGRLGRHTEALRLEKEVLAHIRERLGGRHPETLTAMSNIASTLSELGRSSESLGIHN